jgi:hypothetical protein
MLVVFGWWRWVVSVLDVRVSLFSMRKEYLIFNVLM